MSISPEVLASVAAPMTADAYPKTYRTWGIAWIDKINEMMPKAAVLVDEKAAEANVVYVGLSEDYSKVGTEPVLFVHCEDNRRYYISESHLETKTLPKPIQM